MSEEMVIESEGLSPEDLAMAEEMSKADPPPPEAEQPTAEPEKVESPESEQSEEPENPFVFKVKGEDKEYSKDQLQHLLSREQTFQQKATKLETSDEYQLGLMFKKAQDGDKGAQKKMMEAIRSMAGENDLESLEDTEEEYNREEVQAKQELDSKFEEAFADVKSDVDYDETLGKIESELKGHIPEKLYKQYYDSPDERRTLYDLVKSGRAEEVFGALNEELGKLPLTDRVKIKNDPELYGSLAFEVIQDLNAQKSSSGNEGQAESNLDAVSTGSGSHRVEKEEAAPDFLKMSKEEFQAYEKKMLGRVI